MGLKHLADDRPGLSRRHAGEGFVYLAPTGRPVRDPSTLSRIKSLAIPPAWTDVWICPDPAGHLQATGKDARGRKQYRYHPDFREVRDELKYERMIAFARALPKVRARVGADLKRPGLRREKILAAVVRLLETTLIRVGNEEYARTNKSYGLTTLHNRHATVRGNRIRFQFKGKSGVAHDIDLRDPRLADIVRQCQNLPGQDLFGYRDDAGKPVDVASDDVNAYLQEITGQDFTAKDFRTWAGTLLAAKALQEFGRFDSQAAAKKNIVRAIESVAAKLGNTRAVCRKCYVHPAVLDSYLDGTLAEALDRPAGSTLRNNLHPLKPEEAAVLSLLQQRLHPSPKSPRTNRAA